MQTGATEKTGARPTSRQLPGWNDGAWDTPFGDANLPFSRGSLMQRRMGGLGGPSAIMVTFAAVIAAAVTYLMLRCALYLASARSSRGELRYLAGSEGRTDKGLGEPCGGPAEDPPAATAVAEEEEEVLVEEDLLKQARRYAVELRLLIDRSEPLLRQLESRLRAKCIAAFLCLSLVELSASFSLLERRERVGMNEEIAHISSRISSLRESLGKKQLSRPRHRHIKCLRELLTMLTEVKPAAAALAPRHRLEAIKMLLQLQDVTLVQLNAALVWLRVSLTNSKSANDDAKGAADAAAEGTALFAEDAASAAAEGTASFAEDAAGAAAEGTASFAEGAVSFAEGAVSFVEGAASFAEGAASFAEGVASFAEGVASAADDYAPTAEDVAVAADLRVAAVVQAIEATVYERRTQVLRDPLLSGWLRDTHAVYTRYGIISHGRMEEIAQQPLTTHRELLEALQNSPLGWGDEPWKYIHIEHRDAQQTTTSSVPGTRLRKQIVSSSEDLNSAARLLGPLKASRQGPRRGAGATGRAPASAPLSTSTVTAAAVAEHAALQASSRGMHGIGHCKARGFPKL
ncbi:hypothetical protein, conserved [Eimeria praecox]|uniref:Uncharacterized protein n=1 Tax=Eimeria praecox TaxID=51316 RepID=U6GGU8_9EIME|nr:hypothetical protein, conserved [Eimeria praecox]